MDARQQLLFSQKNGRQQGFRAGLNPDISQ